MTAVITTVTSYCRLPGDTELQLTPRVEAQAPSDAATSGNTRHARFEHARAHWVRTLALSTILTHLTSRGGN